jgi:hypothetical protein
MTGAESSGRADDAFFQILFGMDLRRAQQRLLSSLLRQPGHLPIVLNTGIDKQHFLEEWHNAFYVATRESGRIKQIVVGSDGDQTIKLLFAQVVLLSDGQARQLAKQIVASVQRRDRVHERDAAGCDAEVSDWLVTSDVEAEHRQHCADGNGKSAVDVSGERALGGGDSDPSGHDFPDDPGEQAKIADKAARAREHKPKQANLLVEFSQMATLFHAPDGTAYADLHINGHRETWATRSKSFRKWLVHLFYEETRGAPSSEALQSALNVIEARAQFEAAEGIVFIRIGELKNRLYVDLCDERWRAIEIDADGWRLVDKPPVRFRRTRGMLSLPVPVAGGSVAALRSFLNVKTDAQFVLVVSCLLAYFRCRGPYPVIALSGEQGSAKSTFTAFLRALVDPNTSALRALPREDRDLFIAARNGFVLAFDNVSGLPAWISDTLCRLATGGGVAVRHRYTDQDEVLFDATRPVILNGIEDVVTRPDLADRSVILTLEPIPDERRRTEAEIFTAFETERPRILGALLDAVAEGLKRLPETRLSKLPRMADFALWATACEGALWPKGTFCSAYADNRGEAVDDVLDADPIATTVRTLMSEQTQWSGSAAELLVTLGSRAGDRLTKAKSWPETPRALSGRLRRAATCLRKIGIELEFARAGHAHSRIIKITANSHSSGPEKAGDQPPAPSATSPKSNVASDFAATDPRTDAAYARTQALATADQSTVRTDPLKSDGRAAADDADANNPP